MDAEKQQSIYMSKNRRLIVRTIILILIGLAMAYTIYEIFNKNSIVEAGDMAPNFELETLSGETVTLSDLQGKGVLLNFWGTWCDPCKDEMPALNKAYLSQKVKGVEIVAVNIEETPLVVKNFVNKFNLKFTVLLDKKGVVTDAYNIGPIPTTFLINENGKVVDKLVRPMRGPEDVVHQMKRVQPQEYQK